MKKNKGFSLIQLVIGIIVIIVSVIVITIIILNMKNKEKEEIKTSYSIGDKVILKDDTEWYVIENSDNGSDTITLLARKNIKKDGSGWTIEIGEYKIAFDEANARTREKNPYCTNPEWGCDAYAANGSIVTEDSTIKKLLEDKVESYINDSLTSSGGMNIDSIRLITLDEICNIINAFDNDNDCTLDSLLYMGELKNFLQDWFNNTPTWLYSTNYWTMEAFGGYVNTVESSGNVDRSWPYYDGYYNDDEHGYGIRPVIVTNKSNIKSVISKIIEENDITDNDKNTTTVKSSYSIGDKVILKDNTEWYIIQNSDSSSDTVTLFASKNIKNDASGWTIVPDEYKIAFDEANARTTEKNSYCTDPEWGCDAYAANGSTVTEDSTIKKFMDGKVKSYINDSLQSKGGTNIDSIRLITVDEIRNIINSFDGNNNFTLKSPYGLSSSYNLQLWLLSTAYWVIDPETETYRVYSIFGDSLEHMDHIDGRTISTNSAAGARPVIVTNKSNIK